MANATMEYVDLWAVNAGSRWENMLQSRWDADLATQKEKLKEDTA